MYSKLRHRAIAKNSRNRNLFLYFSDSWKPSILMVVLGLLIFHPRTMLAQTTADGTIHGHITDGSEAALVGVNIIAHSPSVGGTFKAVSDVEGNYRLTELPQGTDYIVEAESSGFGKFVRTGLGGPRRTQCDGRYNPQDRIARSDR